MLIEYNYHTHTYRCGHAEGLDEEYVKHAIALGIKRLGFTDHVMIPGVSQPGVRGDYSLRDDYLSSIRSLKEKYKDKIEILIGFEVEYMEDFLDYYKSLLDQHLVDYFILGQHCYSENKIVKFYFRRDNPIEMIYRYTDDVIKGIKSGLFKYLAHPDLFYNSCHDFKDDIEVCSRRILKACEEYHLPIEVNLCGMNKPGYNEEYMYSSSFFFELAREYDVDVVLGIDAHNPNDFNEENVQKGLDFIARHHLKFLKDFKI